MATERLEIIITSTGGAAAAGQIDGIGKSAQGSASLLGFLRAALVAVAAAEIVTRFTALADAFVNANNKLQLVTNSAQEATSTFGVLLDIANATRTGIDQTANVYQKLAIAFAGTTTPASDILQVVKNLNEALVISGTDSSHATAGLKELAESFGSGIVQSKQLRSILLDIPYLAVIMADKLHIASGELFHFAEANPGTVTPQFMFQAILDYTDKLSASFAKTGATFAQVFIVFQNKLTTFLGQLNSAYGLSTKLGQGLDFVAAHLGQIAAALAALATLVVFNFLIGQALSLGVALTGIFGIVTRLLSVFGLLLVPFSLFRTIAVAIGAIVWLPLVAAFTVISGLISAMLSPAQALLSVMRLLLAAVVADPLFLIGGGVIIGLVAGFYLLHDQIMDIVNGLGGLSGIWNSVVNGAAAAVDVIIKEWQQLPEILEGIGVDMANKLLSGFQKVKDVMADVVKHPLASLTMQPINQAGESVPLPGSEPTAPQLPNPNAAAAQSALDAFNKDFAARQATGTNPVNTGVEATIAKVKQLYATLSGLSGGGTKGAGDLQSEISQFKGVTIPGSSGDQNTDVEAKKTKTLLESISPLYAAQQKWADSTKAVQDAQKYLNAETTSLNAQLKDGTLTTDQYAEKMKDVGQSQAIVSGATTELTLKTAGITDAVKVHNETMEVLKETLDKVPAAYDLITAEMLKTQIAFEDSQTSFGAGVERTFLKMQQQTADVASGIEKTLTGAFSSAEDAVVQFVNTGKISITSLAQTIEDDLLKSALNGLIGQYGGALVGANAPGSHGFGAENTSTVGSLLSKMTGGIFGGSSSAAATGATGASAATTGTDPISSLLGASTQPLSAGMPVYVTNLAGGLGGAGGSGLGAAASGADSAIPTGASSADSGFLSSIEGAFKSIGSEISSVLGSIGSGIGSAASGAGSAISAGASYLSNLTGFASGGSFSVGASSSMGAVNGIDNRLIAFRARDGEQVTVTPPGQSPGGVSIIQNITTPDANSFRRSNGQMTTSAYAGITRAARRNNTQ